MTVDRRRGIVRRANGSLFDERVMRAWLDQQDAARSLPARVRRLSRLTDVPASRRTPDFGPDRGSLGVRGSVDRRQASGEVPARDAVASRRADSQPLDPAGAGLSPQSSTGGSLPPPS